MKKIKWSSNIDWKSKFVDLFIVIIGITIAFQLNNLNETKKTIIKEKEYLKSFASENRDNQKNLALALEFSIKTKNDIDTLKQILISGSYSDQRILTLAGLMMAMSDFHPSLTTMENITSSGEFELIRNNELRKNIILTYNSYDNTAQYEALLSDYIKEYVTPYFFEKIRFRDFKPLDLDFGKDPHFENIVLGYSALLAQKINGYKKNLEKVKHLNELLTNAL